MPKFHVSAKRRYSHLWEIDGLCRAANTKFFWFVISLWIICRTLVMSRHIGPIEAGLQQLVRAYVLEHGHGSATTLGKAIGRSGKWISAFVAGNRALTVDDGEGLAHALNVELSSLRKAPAPTFRLHATDRHELMMRRLFERLDADSRHVLITTAQALVRQEAGRAARDRARRRA